ncbi:LacI family DNA-binding transcriptional regulator [Paenibacillus physcomitrellae]|uniref:LacI family transcriptional regulator n=1 Tax=Paenibacillus physcomitrellae TaxID=1619311 RepID=A0ABQ1G1N9_9BACL|nr:LacI family DNA-binding transcriptional regulator [Paenibacillus physcomitrellae]GGA34933.1 LacI family transcriptional regulator [Paenibacillus physcomitrellae]
MKTKVTMQDIADHLHISKNSVSQALAGKDGVSEATRALVRETAEQMGYVYGKSRRGQQDEAAAHPSSIGPSSGPSAILPDSGTIALIASDYAFSRKSFFGDIYLSVDKELKKYGYELIIQSISPEDAEALRLPAFLENRSVDGILILSHITTSYVQAVLDTGIPTVLIDHHHPSLEADSILTNNRFSAYEGVRHLIELGHRDIGFMGDIDYSPSHYERLEGMRLAAFEAGLKLREDWLIQDAVEDSSYVHGTIAEMKERPTAWFCVNDGFGFMITSALQHLGIKVPEEVSVVSFDNGYLSQVCTPSTTTLDVNRSLFASYALKQLFSRLENPQQPYTEILLPTQLLIRESTAPPPEKPSE